MSKKNIKFEDEKVNKRSFSTKTKKLLKMEDIDINKILVSKKVPYGKESIKYYIEYNDDDVIRSLSIKLPQMIGYVKHFNNNNNKDNKTMSFKVSDNNLLKKNTKIWEKISNLTGKEFDSETGNGDNNKYIKTKIKQYTDKINTNF